MQIWSIAKHSLHLALLLAPLACSQAPVANHSDTLENAIASLDEEIAEEPPFSADTVRDAALRPVEQPRVTLFLNRDGGTFTKGKSSSSANRSSLVPEDVPSATLAGFQGTDAQWREIVSCVEEQFAPYNVAFTEEEPAEGKYIEAIIGGQPQALGLSNKTVGIAPMDTRGFTVLDEAVVFVFAERLGEENTGRICEVAAQEIGHALGLDHSYLCEDPMSYLKGCGVKRFQNVDARCGEHSPRDCKSGETTQNTVALLTEKLGVRDASVLPPAIVDEAPPQIAIVEPDEKVAPPGDGVVVAAEVQDDVSVSRVDLVYDEGGKEVSVSCERGSSKASCRREGDRYVWRLKSDGTRTFRLRAEDPAGRVAESPEQSIASSATVGASTDEASVTAGDDETDERTPKTRAKAPVERM